MRVAAVLEHYGNALKKAPDGPKEKLDFLWLMLQVPYVSRSSHIFLQLLLRAVCERNISVQGLVDIANTIVLG